MHISKVTETICKRARFVPYGKHAQAIEAEIRQAIADAYPELYAAAFAALEHVEELRDAWQRGTLDERQPANDGWRSNRNVEVEVKLREALKPAKD